MPYGNDTTRRDVLNYLPAAAFVPVSAGANETTPILMLFQEWQRLENLIQATDEGPEADRLVAASLDLELRLCEMPIVGPADLAAKYMAYTGWGVFCFSEDAGAGMIMRDMLSSLLAAGVECPT